MNVLSALPTVDPATNALIDLEYRRELFRRAAEHVRGDVQEPTWLAFELTALQHVPIDKAARVLGISTGSVYAARSRVMRRIRDRVVQLEASAFASEESS